MKDQPDLKDALERAPLLKTESLGEPARGVNVWERWFVPNHDGKTWDLLQIYFKEYYGPTWLHAVDFGTGKVTRQRLPDGHQFYLSGRALGFEGKYYIATPSHQTGNMDLFVYDPAENKLEERGEIVRGNRVQKSGEGVYFYWGAQHGLYEKNVIEDCGYGMPFGHSDSDNLIRDNDIRRCTEAGIRFRGGNKAFAPHRNHFENNRIIDGGGENGVAIEINGETEDVVVRGNQIRETRAPKSRIGFLIDKGASGIRYEDNQIEGFATAISDLSKR